MKYTQSVFKAILTSFIFSCVYCLWGCGSSGETTSSINFVSLPEGAIQPLAQKDEEGKIHVIYFKGDAAGGNLFYCLFDETNQQLGTPVRVNSQDNSAIATGTIRGAELAIGKQGTVHVLWNGSGAAALPVSDSVEVIPLLYSRLEGQEFLPQANLIQGHWGLDGGSAIAADKEGNVYVAWHARGNEQGEEYRRVYMRKSGDNGGSFSDEVPVNDPEAGACGCCGMHLRAGVDGSLYGLYRSAGDRRYRDVHLISSGDGGNSFEDKVLDKWEIDACPMSSMSSAVADNRVAFTWQTEGKVYYAFKEAQPQILLPEFQNEGSKHSRIALSGEGYYLMAWTEGTGWNKGGDLAWELYDGVGKVLQNGRKTGAVSTWSFPAVVNGAGNTFYIFY